MHEPTRQDKDDLRRAVMSNPPCDVLAAVSQHIQHRQSVMDDHAQHYRMQRDTFAEEKRTEWKRAETAELWRTVWCILACAGWLCFFILGYLHHLHH